MSVFVLDDVADTAFSVAGSLHNFYVVAGKIYNSAFIDFIEIIKALAAHS